MAYRSYFAKYLGFLGSYTALGALLACPGCADGASPDDTFDLPGDASPGFPEVPGASSDAGIAPLPTSSLPTTPVIPSGSNSSSDAGRSASASSTGSSSSSSNRPNSGSASSDAGTKGSGSSDAGDPFGGILDGVLGAINSDAGSSGSSGSSSTASARADGGQCGGDVCFDVFDCYIFYPDKIDCGYTACDGFVCK